MGDSFVFVGAISAFKTSVKKEQQRIEQYKNCDIFTLLKENRLRHKGPFIIDVMCVLIISGVLTKGPCTFGLTVTYQNVLHSAFEQSLILAVLYKKLVHAHTKKE